MEPVPVVDGPTAAFPDVGRRAPLQDRLVNAPGPGPFVALETTYTKHYRLPLVTIWEMVGGTEWNDLNAVPVRWKKLPLTRGAPGGIKRHSTLCHGRKD